MKTAYAIILSLILAASPFALKASATDDARRVDRWITVTPPSQERKVEYALFSYASNYSDLEWQVYSKDGMVLADEDGSQPPSRLKNSPEFEAAAGRFKGPYATHPVEDGWLIGYNYGEFGASLFWFSADGREHYKISDHQIVDFVVIGDQVYAIEGLAHLGISEGSLIHVSPDAKTGRWTASTSLKFPSAPYALVPGENNTIYVVLSDALVAVEDARKLVTLMPDADLGSLYPNSAVLSPDGSSLYIGMRQFVGDYDLNSNSFRLLIPDESMLNRLSREDKDLISKTVGE